MLHKLSETTQTISFSEGDGVCSAEVYASDVVVTSNAGSHNHGSSKVKIKSLVDYNWEPKFYFGQLLAVHMAGKYLAYSIKAPNNANPGTWSGMVRVVYSHESGSDQRALIKGMKGEVQDLAFAYLEQQVLLACIDEQGNFYVHEIYTTDTELKCELLAEIREDTGTGCSFHRIVWCPYIPDEEDMFPDLDVAKLLVTTHDNVARMWNMNSVVSLLRECSTDGGVRACAGALIGREGVVTVSEHGAPLVEATFSPDGTALATASTDGYVMFFQLYDDEKPPQCIHKWQPHGGKPLSCLFFLDNHCNFTNDVQFWKFAVTGAENNAVLKIWSCKSWTCIQTITFTPNPGSDLSLGLKVTLDISANYLLLSDFRARSLYVLHMTKYEEDAVVHCKSISEFLLPYPVLSFCIIDTNEQAAKCESNCSDPFHRNGSAMGDIRISPTDYDLRDMDGMNESCVNGGGSEPGRKVRLRLYIVQPKGLQEGELIFCPPEPNVDMLHGLTDISLGEDAKDSSTGPEVRNQFSILQQQSQELKNLLMRAQPLASSLIVQQSESPHAMPMGLNLMTPDAFSSPGKRDDEDPPLASTPEIGKNTSNRAGTSSSTERASFGLESVEPPCDVKFTSGGSSPSREVQKIMSLDQHYYKEEPADDETDTAREDSVFAADAFTPTEKSQSTLTHGSELYNSDTAWPQISMAQINEANQRKASSDKSSSQSLNTSAIESAILAPTTVTVATITDERIIDHPIVDRPFTLCDEDRSKLDELDQRLGHLTEMMTRLERHVAGPQDNGGSTRDLIERALQSHTERTVLAIENALADGWERVMRAGEAAGSRAAQIAGVNAARALEPLAKALQHELATKLTATDHLLKDNIEKLATSKTVLDHLSNKMSGVVSTAARDAFRETVSHKLLPPMEKAHAQMFQQLNNTFNNGVKEFTTSTETAARAATERGATAAAAQLSVALERHADALTAAAAAAATMPTPEHYSRVIHDSVRNVLEKEMVWFRDHTRSALVEMSRAHSPATPASSVHGSVADRQMQAAQIQAMMGAGDINGAFQLALSASDLTLVMAACRAANPEVVFASPPRLKQHVLLSLVQQLAADMTQDTHLKHKYLEEALMNLDTSNPVTREHLPVVMRELQKHLLAFLASNPEHPLGRKFKMLLMATNSLIKGGV